jgi:hypothetical protein
MRPLIALCLALVLAPVAAAAKPTAPATKPVGPIFGVRAIGNPKLGYFVYPASAGSVLHGAVAVTNTGDQTGSVKLYTADATTGATSGTVYLTDSRPAGVGTWISLHSPTLTLKPSQRTIVPFTVHVPAGANAGDYVGGIVAETVLQRQGPQSSHKTNVQIKVRNLSIVAVEVNVPGPQVAKFTIGDVKVGGSQGRQQVFVHLANDGTILAKPKGSITIKTSTGTAIQTISFHLDTFLAHTAIDYPIQLRQALSPGTYVASVRLTYPGSGAAGGTATSSASPQFTVSKENVQKVFKPGKPTNVGPGGVVAAPASSSSLYKWIAIGFGALLLAGGGYFFAVVRQRRPVTVTATPVPPPPPAAGPPAVAPPAVAEPAVAQPRAAPAGERCQGHHYWQVDWMQGQVGPDGVLRYPHRCRNCGIEVRAADIGEAAQKAAALESPA